jgi:hypothetical protein
MLEMFKRANRKYALPDVPPGDYWISMHAAMILGTRACQP